MSAAGMHGSTEDASTKVLWSAGLAVRDFWSVDDDTVVFVADPSLGGNILNFNVGGNIDLRIPRVRSHTVRQAWSGHLLVPQKKAVPLPCRTSGRA
jgi:hypothetical protein